MSCNIGKITALFVLSMSIFSHAHAQPKIDLSDALKKTEQPACKPYVPPPKYEVSESLPVFTKSPIIIKTVYDWEDIEVSMRSLPTGEAYVLSLPAIYHKSMQKTLLESSFIRADILFRSNKHDLKTYMPDALKAYKTGKALYQGLLSKHKLTKRFGDALIQTYVFRHEMAHVWMADRVINNGEPFKGVPVFIEQDRAQIYAKINGKKNTYMSHGGVNFFEDANTREAFADFYGLSVLKDYEKHKNYSNIRSFLIQAVALHRLLNLYPNLYCDNPFLKTEQGYCTVMDEHHAALASLLWLWEHPDKVPNAAPDKAFTQFANALGSYFGGANALSSADPRLYTRNIHRIERYMTNTLFSK